MTPITVHSVAELLSLSNRGDERLYCSTHLPPRAAVLKSLGA
jgi:hypothetical protein